MPRKKATKIKGEKIPTRVVPPSRDTPVTSETVTQPAILAEIRDYAREGCSLEQIAQRLLVTRKTLYRWSKQFPQVLDVITEGRKVADDRVEQSLYEMCFSHDEKEIVIEKDATGNVVKQVIRTKHVPANVTAIQYWLQNRRRDEWKNRQEHEFAGDAVIPVQIVYDLEEKERPTLNSDN